MKATKAALVLIVAQAFVVGFGLYAVWELYPRNDAPFEPLWFLLVPALSLLFFWLAGGLSRTARTVGFVACGISLLWILAVDGLNILVYEDRWQERGQPVSCLVR
jgi:hypothetical protein